MATTLSSQVLESYRGQGRTDIDIADEFASQSPEFATQYQKIKTKYGDDKDAVKAFMNVKFYGNVDHNVEKPNIITRSLNAIYDNYKKDIGDIKTSQSQYRSGQQGYVDTGLQNAGNIFSILTSPVSQPVNELVGSASNFAYENIPGVKPVIQSVAQSRLVQQGIKPTVQNIAQYVTEESQRNPALRTLGSVGEGAIDYMNVVAAGQAANASSPMLKGSANIVSNIPSAISNLPNATARGIGNITNKMIVEPSKSFGRAALGYTDDAARSASPIVPKTALVGKAQEAVKLGMGEDMVRFAVGQNPETRAVMSNMTKIAARDSGQLGGSVAHKEILGGQVMNNLAHILEQKETVGKALGTMKSAMSKEVVDLTNEYDDFLKVLQKKGAVIDDKGQITSLAAAADSNIPLLQKTLDFLAPAKDGRTIKLFSNVDDWRGKMFEEISAEKSRLQPSASGTPSLDFAENTVDGVRSSIFLKAAGANDRLIAYNRAYEQLSRESKSFLKAIGYKGKLRIEDITAKQLRAGEIALRQLGNASADVRDSFRSMIATAKKYGYSSNVDVEQLVRWTDALEDLFPITPTRSLQGGVSRATKDATGKIAEDVLDGGVTRTVWGVMNEQVLKAFDSFRGMTPENRLKVLLEILDAPPDTPFLKVLDDSLPDSVYDDIIKNDLQGIKVSDVSPIAKNIISDQQIGNMRQQSQLGLSATDDLSSARKSTVGEIPSSPTTIPSDNPSVNIGRKMDLVDKKLGKVQEGLNVEEAIQKKTPTTHTSK